MCFEHVQSEKKLHIARLVAVCQSTSKDGRRKYQQTSMTEKEHGRKRSATLSCALWTRPRILASPAPRAMPENRWSIRRIILECVNNDLGKDNTSLTCTFQHTLGSLVNLRQYKTTIIKDYRKGSLIVD